MPFAAFLDAPLAPVTVHAYTPPEPGPGEAAVRLEACGICHSDVMITGLEKLPLSPLILGHEGIGVVTAVGPDVTEVQPGDRVGITYFASSCGKCDACHNGYQRFCARQTNHGYTRHGALATETFAAVQSLVKVPAALSAAEAAPLCCAGWTAMGAIREARVQPGETVAIVGFGGLGHLALQYIKALGANAAVVDVSEPKLEHARDLGAIAVTTPENARKVLLKNMGGVDAALVFTASAAIVPTAISSLKRRGRAVLVGLTTDTYAVSPTELVIKGITIQGSYLGSKEDLAQVFTLAEQGIVKAKVSTHPLDQAPDLISQLKQGRITGRAVIAF
ncbi:MAG: alcohol dehydrogenase catalytic domain-containing protein [Bryobacterales bacterium]|nr:alcohol dehydrogenase catalytic domain-containing protein [Bryobacterales bacterium]